MLKLSDACRIIYAPDVEGMRQYYYQNKKITLPPLCEDVKRLYHKSAHVRKCIPPKDVLKARLENYMNWVRSTSAMDPTSRLPVEELEAVHVLQLKLVDEGYISGEGADNNMCSYFTIFACWRPEPPSSVR